MELEQLADPAERGAYRAAITPRQPFLIAGRDLVRAVAEDLAAGRGRAGVVAARFHNGVAGLITDGCLLLRERHGLSTVALSGGVFQNLLLLHADRRPAGGARVRRPGALAGPVQRRRDQPRPGGRRRGAATAAERRDGGVRYSCGAGVRRRSQSYHSCMPAPVVADSCSISASGAGLPDVGGVPLGVEVHVGQQVGLAHQDQVGLAEHVRVLHAACRRPR